MTRLSSIRARRAIPVALAATLVLGGCASDHTTAPDPVGGRGELLSARVVQTQASLLIGSAEALLGLNGIPARYAVQMYAITYRTVDVTGQPTVASGAVFLPVNPTGAVPLMSYSHGTVVSKTDVPSNPNSQEGPDIGLVLASAGNVVAMADYLGLGSSGGFHPYVHAASEASAGLDALRAARVLAAQQHVGLDGHLFVFGYSQGGHAAMALAREIEQHATPEFTLTAAAPMSGPYDIYGTATAYIADPTPNTAASEYTVYVIAAYNAVYHMADRLDQLLKPPYDAVAASLLAGTISSDDLSRSVAPTPSAMMQPGVVQAVLTDPTSPLARALHDNDVYDWKPRAPMRLYYASADRSVPPQNARTAEARMRQLGADVEAVNLGPLSHGDAAIPALLAGYLWFSGFR